MDRDVVVDEGGMVDRDVVVDEGGSMEVMVGRSLVDTCRD